MANEMAKFRGVSNLAAGFFNLPSPLQHSHEEIFSKEGTRYVCDLADSHFLQPVVKFLRLMSKNLFGLLLLVVFIVYGF